MAGSVQAEIIGYIGGAFLAICCIPQFMKMYENQSAKDVSLLYTFLYVIGLIFTLSYMIMLDATAAIVTISFEVAVALAVVALKLYFDYGANTASTSDGESGSDGDQVKVVVELE